MSTTKQRIKRPAVAGEFRRGPGGQAVPLHGVPTPAAVATTPAPRGRKAATTGEE